MLDGKRNFVSATEHPKRDPVPKPGPGLSLARLPRWRRRRHYARPSTRAPVNVGRRAAQVARPREHGGVRRYVGFAVIGAIALIACIGIRDLWFHDDFRRSPVTSPTEARSGDDRVACQVEGQNFVTVPILIGKPLAEAAAKARASGLQLVGTGVSGGDPDGAAARVFAQKPPSGTRVPVGACIGFRTRA